MSDWNETIQQNQDIFYPDTEKKKKKSEPSQADRDLAVEILYPDDGPAYDDPDSEEYNHRICLEDGWADHEDIVQKLMRHRLSGGE